VKKALDPPPPQREPTSPAYGSAGVRPPSPLAPISSGRLRTAPQRLDASVVTAPLSGKDGSAREASGRKESEAAPEAAAEASAAPALAPALAPSKATGKRKVRVEHEDTAEPPPQPGNNELPKDGSLRPRTRTRTGPPPTQPPPPAPAVGEDDAVVATPPAQNEATAPKVKRERAQAAGAPRLFACVVPGCDKAYMDQKGLTQHHNLKHPELQMAGGIVVIGVGSRVQDSEGICGEIVEANIAWLTMRTDAGEERKMRKMALKLIASESVTSVTSEVSQLAGSDVHITRTRTRDERDAEARRNAIDLGQPTVTDVPEGEWLCPPCAHDEEGDAAAATDDDDAKSDADADADADAADDADDDDDEDECAACLGADSHPGNEIMLCDGDGCDSAWHQLCLRPAVLDVPEGAWHCPHCAVPSEAWMDQSDAGTEERDAEQLGEVEEVECRLDLAEGEEECAACRGADSHPGNEIMLCDGDGCDRVWHQLCLWPAVGDVPEGDEAWLCPRCAVPADGTAAQGATRGSSARGGSGAAAEQRVRTSVGPEVLRERPAKRLAPLAQEEALCECEEDGNLRFQLLRAERWEPGSVVAATSLPSLLSTRSLYATCLPMMDGAYLAKMVFDPRHHSLVCITSDTRRGTVAAALTFRLVADQTGGTAGAAGSFAGFAELELCAVMRRFQVRGIGSRLVSHFKREMAARGVLRLVTTADNYAIGFWAQQGFTRTAAVAGVGSYDGGILMACQLSEAIPYTRMPQAVRACRELLLRSWEPEEAPPPDAGGQLGAAPRSRGLESSLRLLERSDESENAATLGIGILSATEGQGRELSLRDADGNGMGRMAKIYLADESPRMDVASRLQLAAATSQAHEALPPAVRETQARCASTSPPAPSRAHALAAHTTRTRARFYTTGPQAMAELHRYGIGAVAITHGATRAALLPLAPPTPNEPTALSE